ncbi:ATP-binding protein [Roseospira visakhapatnamensis]|uniref:histidine kinase n=1 Tax=Roseospira visakhapatnamensis TaxID=390880 RepID=A0A7W6W893_9PROT|nr:ATP-binding protein [Roseospira visakhapatnamensis]MBB4264604.1 signal transduction histidine kinase [Roseospira visakhapatnamensis]
MTPVAPRRVVILAVLATLGWTATLAVSLGWELSLLRDQVLALGRFQAQGAFDRDLSYRLWNAATGGVYASAEVVEPNPYLEVEHRDLDTVAGPLTLVNPAYMTRIVHGIAAKRSGIVSHITSLEPIRPANAPAPWEREALAGFAAGDTVHTSVVTADDGAEVLRFMRPLSVEEPCLACHEKQGYAVGDVRGGISVIVPLAPIAAIVAPTRTASLIGHASVWLLGLVGIGLGALAMVRLGARLETARHRAEQTDQAKSRFLATMSHELRTPLNAVLGFSQVMEQNLFGPLGSGQYDGYARDIRKSGEHLLGLINDVLDLSKIESGRLTLEDQPLSLADRTQDALELMREQARGAGLRLDHDIPPDQPDLLGDPRALRQMLLNLLSNAIRFTPTGGHVRVSASVDEHGGQALSVRDTGVGIPEDQLHKVLQPFHQAPTPRQRGERGTGLGLTLVEAFMGLHGGTVEIQSRVDGGTTVTLRFPARRSLAPSPRDRPRGGPENRPPAAGGDPGQHRTDPGIAHGARARA